MSCNGSPTAPVADEALIDQEVVAVGIVYLANVGTREVQQNERVIEAYLGKAAVEDMKRQGLS